VHGGMTGLLRQDSPKAARQDTRPERPLDLGAIAIIPVDGLLGAHVVEHRHYDDEGYNVRHHAWHMGPCTTPTTPSGGFLFGRSVTSADLKRKWPHGCATGA
jgi:hypothetical protein